MRFDCTGARDHIDAWVLGALDTDDARALDAHVAGCVDCQRLADEALEYASNVALAVPLVAAPHSLKARVIASAAVLRDIKPQSARWWPAAAAAMLVVAAGTLAWGAYLQVRVDDLSDQNATISERAALQSQELATVRVQITQADTQADSLAQTVGTQDELLEIVAGSDVRRTPMAGTAMAPGASGIYLWNPDEQAGAFIGRNLPALPPGKAYCLWFVYDGGWVNRGLFDIDDDGSGRLLVPHAGDPEGRLGALRGYAVSIQDAAAGDPDGAGATVLLSAE